MDFDDDSRLDVSQIEDERGGGLPFGGIAVGGGAIGLVALLVAVVLGVDPRGLLGGGDDGPRQAAPGNLARCRTGADADQSEDCRIVGIVNSVQAYWKKQFADRDRTYTVARTRLFSGSTQTACGAATSAVGPFYCPGDQRVYLDLGFFQELQGKFGAKGGPFAQAYVVAHEYGHHVQDVLGTMRRVGSEGKGAAGGSVRLELQADCYAGVWAKHAVATGFFSKPFTQRDIDQALDAAGAVGDDRIQRRVRGREDPESFTHGTSAQRQKWFSTGYDTGRPARCNTFSGEI